MGTVTHISQARSAKDRQRAELFETFFPPIPEVSVRKGGWTYDVPESKELVVPLDRLAGFLPKLLPSGRVAYVTNATTITVDT